MTTITQPLRIVSLVPSLTEAIAGFGLLDRLIGRTRYCVEPAGQIEGVETVGGTKDPDVNRIVALRPDLVIVNREENRREDCEALEAAGVPVHVTHPRSLGEAVEMLEVLGGVLGTDEGARLAAACRSAMARVGEAVAGRERRRAFCPIWRRPWMSFRDSTYVGDMLSRSGCLNIFGQSQSRDEGKPGGGGEGRGEPGGEAGGKGRSEDGDFFEISLEEVVAARPEVVLLPDEPYTFEAKHGEELSRAGIEAYIVLIDGKDLAWYGPRIPGALERLARAVEGGRSG